MTTLKEAAMKLGITETEAMNMLQDKGKVSDNCETFADVPLCDMWKAAAWLIKQKGAK
jgi:hypothetical protein